MLTLPTMIKVPNMIAKHLSTKGKNWVWNFPKDDYF